MMDGILISREDLESARSTPVPPDPTADRFFRESIQQTYGLSPQRSPGESVERAGFQSGKIEISDEEELEFRLFASSANPALHDIRKIKIHSPDRSNDPPGFIIPERPKSYYFQGVLTTKRQEGLVAAAVTGSEVLAQSKSPWPGCKFPWRVTNIKADSNPVPTQCLPDSRQQPAEQKDKPSRIGKKARILKRKKLAAAKEVTERKAQQEVEKERAEREKKSRINRKKQIKKRKKASLKKVEGAVETDPS